jgi:hypothetical protein
MHSKTTGNLIVIFREFLVFLPFIFWNVAGDAYFSFEILHLLHISRL